MSDPVIFYSNELEPLYQRLRRLLFNESVEPFSKRIVVVPHELLKNWLFFRMTRDPEVGVAAGIEISFLNHIDAKLEQNGILKPGASEQKKTVSVLELSFRLEAEIKKVLSDFSSMSSDEQELWKPLMDYLKFREKVFWTVRVKKRLILLCERLSRLFSQYERFGEGVVSGWEETSPPGWQETLWVRLFGERGSYLPFFKKLSTNIEAGAAARKAQVHVFAPEYFPKVQHEFFRKLSGLTSVFYYALSPCQLFWTDLRTDRESRFIQGLWKKKGVSGALQEDLEVFLRDRNPLLANLGRLGREFFLILEDSDAQTFEQYFLPLGLDSIKQYEELLYDDIVVKDKEGERRVLDFVKADMMLLRNPLSEERIFLESYDKSIQLHVTCSRQREVQAVYDVIMGIISDHVDDSDPIKASDVLVVLPDVGEYEGVIRSVFGHENSQLDYRILDFPFLAKSSIAEGFLALLSLVEGRWDVASIFQVFEHPAFQYRHGLSTDDIQLMRYWIKETGVRWGLDHTHREEALSKDYCQNEMVEKSSVATWDHGIGQLLMGLSMVIDEEEYLCGDFLQDVPCRNIDFSQSELLGKMIKLIASLRDDLKVLSDGTVLTLGEWSSYLTCILDAYFSVALGNTSEQSHYDILLRKLKSLSEVSENISEEKYNFLSVFRRLEMALKKEKSRWQEGHIESVCFGSGKSLRAIPARVICLMGMEDGKFPRVQNPHVLNLMTGKSEADYIPRSSDEDRYSFLESILSTGDYFIMSQVGVAQGDSREISPSLVTTELLNYLDTTFEIGGKKLSDLCVVKHPQLPFNCTYFNGTDSVLRSYSPEYFRVAKSLYGEKIGEEKNFIPELFSNKTAVLKDIGDLQSEVTINVKDLTGAVSNPLKLYFNKNLGIYLGKEEERVLKTEEEFTLSGLDHAVLKREALRRPVKEVLKLAEKRGRLPLGAFKEVAFRRLERDVESWKENMENMGADPASIFNIEMRKNCDSPFSLPNGDWIVPSLELKYSDSTKVHIVGRLSSLTPQGLLAFAKDSPEDILKVWPQYVVYDAIASTFEKPLERQLLFLKDGKMKPAFFDDAYPVLRLLVDYYFTCMKNVSPMIPEWFEVIWKKDPYKLQKKVKDSLGDGFQGSYNDYLKWMMSGGERVPAEGILDLWREYALHIFGELVKEWMPKVEGKGGKKRA